MIIIKNDNKTYRLRVALISNTNRFDYFMVMGKNRFISLRSNRPQLLQKGLKHKRAEWKLLDGVMYNVTILNCIIDELEELQKTIVYTYNPNER